MEAPERNFWSLALLGAFIGLGKLLVSHEVLTPRLILGRTILGSAVSLIAGVALVRIPDLPPIAMLGIGSALGIAGSQVVEAYFKRKAGEKP